MSRCATMVSVLPLSAWMFWCHPQAAVGADKECGTTSSLDSDQAGCPLSDCPRKGLCDCPGTRDEWIPGGSTVPVTMRVKFNVFHALLIDDVAKMEAQRDKINFDFEPHKIDFQVDWDFYPGTQYAQVETEAEVSSMKSAYADNPSQQLNVYVVDVLIDTDNNGQVDYFGSGVYPWSFGATGAQGGILVDGDRFGSGFTLLTHELGHVLGLWHTFHGTNTGELTNHGGLCASPGAIPCDYCCYESAECTGTCSDPNCDLLGDFCCDTPGTIVQTVCQQVDGTDECTTPNKPWSGGAHDNYMTYTPQSCRDEFTTQQGARMHCWTM